MTEIKNQSVQKIVNYLLKRIYEKTIKPGEKLPPFRAYAKELDVDPALLRTALKQMETMNLLEIKRSDGVYVNNFMESAGVDFLSMLFSIPDSGGGDPVVDEFLVDEALAFWNIVFPEIMFVAFQRLSPLDIKKLLGIIDRQMVRIDEVEELVAMDIETQDIIANFANNMIISLLFNSLRPLRYRMTEVFYRGLDRDNRMQFLQMKKKGLCRQMSGELDLKWSSEAHRKALETYRRKIRQSIANSVLREE